MRNPEENLPREARLLELLGNPQEQYTSTLIAGTKGKGSTAALIERVLRQAGVRTGLYTQPDLHTFRERMRVNGRLISEEEVTQLVPEIGNVVERIQADEAELRAQRLKRFAMRDGFGAKNVRPGEVETQRHDAACSERNVEARSTSVPGNNTTRASPLTPSMRSCTNSTAL